MKKLVVALICLLLAGAVAAWYFLRDKDKARNVLPADAMAVAVFEPVELFKELDFPLSKVPKLVMNFEGLVEAVDLTEPVYAFASEDGLSGFALNVKDADKLLDVASSFGFASEEQRGLHWIANRNSIGCLDKDKLLLLAPVPETQQDALRDEMVKLMSQSRQDVPVLETAERQKGVVRASVSLSNLPDILNRQLAKTHIISGEIINSQALSEAILGYAFNIEKKALVHSLRLEGVETLPMPLSPIKGSLIGLEPEEPFVWACVNMRGEELLLQLRQVPLFRTALLALNMCVDADMMMKAIDGDVTLAIPQAGGRHVDFLLTATLDNTDFLANAGDWSVTRRGRTDFVTTQYGANVFFGVRDDKLYIASSERLANKACQEADDAEDFQKEAKGKYLCASLDLEKLFESASRGFSPTAIVLNIPQIREAVDALNCVSLTVDSPQSLELRVETDKPVKDIFSSFFSIFSGDK